MSESKTAGELKDDGGWTQIGSGLSGTGFLTNCPWRTAQSFRLPGFRGSGCKVAWLG